jgi:hypothetical protein
MFAVSVGTQMKIPNSIVRVVETDPRTDPRWEPFVAAHPEGTIYHHPFWIAALEEESRQPGVHLACEDSAGRLTGILPLLYTRGLPLNFGDLLTGRRLSSLPRTPVAGPLSITREATTALIHAAIERGRKEPGYQLQLKTQSPQLDGLVEGLVHTPWRLSYLLELPDNPEEIRFGNSVTRHRIKWAVNKATKLGLQVRAAENESELRAWYHLYLHAMRRNAVPPRSYRFFRTLWDLLYPNNLMRLLLAERTEAGRRTLLAGSIFFLYGRTVSYAFTGSMKKDLYLHPNDIIQWRAIRDAAGEGFRWYDFGEVPQEHQELANFKRKWGSQPTQLYRYYYPASPKVASSGPTSVGCIRRVVTAHWHRLPLNTTAMLGDWIYRYL